MKWFTTKADVALAAIEAVKQASTEQALVAQESARALTEMAKTIKAHLDLFKPQRPSSVRKATDESEIRAYLDKEAPEHAIARMLREELSDG